MNKMIFRRLLVYLLFIIPGSYLLAQSDYELVQRFKTECSEINSQIKDASSLDELNRIYDKVDKVRKNYARNSDLLNKALYPEKYETMISDLTSLYAIRKSDFTTVDVVKGQVSDLEQRVDTLSTMNEELRASLDELQLLFDKSRKETSDLNNIIADLKEALHKRDVLVMDMVDSLMPPVMREKPMLTSEDKENIKTDIERDNILVNVKATIKDNIKYLDLTSLQPEDIRETQIQQLEFADTWSRIGPRLVEVYSDDSDRVNELREIDSLFFLWTYAVEDEVWQSIKEDFETKGIPLTEFSNGEEFTNSVTQYILSETSAIEEVPEDEAKNSFVLFADSAWSSKIEPKWTPFLIENGMLAENNKDVIEAKIDVWRSELYPSKWWIWLIIPAIFLALLAFLIPGLKRRSHFFDLNQE